LFLKAGMKTNINKELIIFTILLMITSMIYSKFLLSVSMFGMMLFALLGVEIRPLRFRLHSHLFAKFKDFWRAPQFWMLTLPVLAYLISGWHSEDLGEWFWRVRTKAPFFFLPLAFFMIPKISARDMSRIFQFYVLLAAFSMLLVMGNYWLHQAEMIELLRVGKAVPTPCHHIRYSLFISFAAVCGIHFIRTTSGREQKLFIGLTILLILGLHITAVRSGLVALYIGSLVYILITLEGKKRWLYGVSTIGFIILAPILFYYISPSFQQKVHYIKYDWEQFQKNNNSDYSDSERWISLSAGLNIWKRNALMGTGVGDIRSEMQNELKAMGHPPDLIKFPHSQILFILCGCGVIGALIFFTGLLGPLIYTRPRESPLLYAFYCGIGSSFLVENTLETAVGTAIFIGFVCLGVPRTGHL